MPLRHDGRNRLMIVLGYFGEPAGYLPRGCNQFRVTPGITVDDKRRSIRIFARDFQNAMTGAV